VTAGKNLHKLHVGPLREKGMLFQKRRVSKKILIGKILREDHAMRIAEGKEAGMEKLLSQKDPAVREKLLWRGKGHPYAHRLASVICNGDHPHARLCHNGDPFLPFPAGEGEQNRRALQSVSAKLCLRAVGIKDPHEKIRVFAGTKKHKPVPSDAEMSAAK
jgi:hypothetical protein